MNTIVKSNAQPGNPVVRSEGSRPEAPRKRNPNLGGARMKLAVHGEIEGYHLYWANDDQGGIEELLHEGFEFVEAKEVGMEKKTRSSIVEDADLDTRVSRHVGMNSAGAPMKAFLLKCTDELWQERDDNRHERADAWDESIMRQENTQIEKNRKYTPEGYKTQI